MTDHDRAKLTGCEDALITKLDRVLSGMAAAGFSMIVTDGLRSLAQQQALLAQGRTTAGPIVTNADGTHSMSSHQTGRAADCCFLDGQGRPTWDSRYPWAAYGALAAAVGLVWGGSWHALHDLPHVELPPTPPSAPPAPSSGGVPA